MFDLRTHPLPVLLLCLAACSSSTAHIEPPAAPAKPAALKAPAPQPRTHVVAPGETAYSISKRYGVTVADLASANEMIDPTRLSIGDRLVIPVALAVSPATPETPRRVVPVPTPDESGTKLSAEAERILAQESAHTAERSVPVRSRVEPTQDLEAIEADVRVAPAAPVAAGACKSALPKRGAKTPFLWPVDGVVVSSFGHREGAPHEGIDIGAPSGSPIWAAQAGSVVFSGERAGYGRLVILNHASGAVTIYAHNAENCVREGARVAQGDVIGLVGSSGGATSPQTHFEIRLQNKATNPRAHLPE